jgi:zinc protease
MNTATKVLALFAVFAAPAFAATHIAEHVTRERVAGIDVIIYPTSIKDVISIVGALPAGDAVVGEGNIALPSLTAWMLDRGTTTEDQFAVAAKLEAVGARVGFGIRPQTLGVAARMLKKDLPLVMGLIAEQLRDPAFKAEEFEKVKQQFEGWIEQSTIDTEYRAAESFSRLAFPLGHPNRQYSIDEYRAALKIATLDDVKAYHRGHYGPAHMTLVVVGDADPTLVRKQVERAFAGWAGGEPLPPLSVPATLTAARTDVVQIAGKTSVSAVLGAPTGLQYRDPDALALRVGTAVLGYGFTGRLMGHVRDEQGLTYSIGADLSNDTFSDGNWEVDASFAPQLLDRGVAATRHEIESWWKRGITERELTARKEGLIGNFRVNLATTGGMAYALLQAVQRGYDVSWLDEYPDAINVLTTSQVNAAIKKHVDPTRLVLVEAGTVP